jgi:hypothetical protein
MKRVVHMPLYSPVGGAIAMARRRSAIVEIGVGLLEKKTVSFGMMECMKLFGAWSG